MTLLGLTSLWINRGLMVTPEINHRRVAFVLGRIDEILSWEKTKEQEKDVRFVELGEYLCEVRAKQYWRLEKLNSFDEFLERRFADSRRKAYYLMTIHEHLTRVPKPSFARWVGQRRASSSRWRARMELSPFVHPGCTRQRNFLRSVQEGGRAEFDGETRQKRGKFCISRSTRVSWELLRKPLQPPRFHVGFRQIPRLLP